MIMNQNNASLMEAAMLELSQAKDADYGEQLNKASKYNYVLEHHKWAITQMKGAKEGYWKTHVQESNGNRLDFVRKGRDQLIDDLYNYYERGNGANKTFASVYEELTVYKRDVELTSAKTVADYKDYYRRFMEPLGGRKVGDFTEDDLRKWIVQDVLPTQPKDMVFKRLLVYVRLAFRFAVRRQYIKANPMEFIEAKDYQKHCNHQRKVEEDTYFTADEIQLIREEMFRHLDNPRALIVLLNIEMGMRADEPVAIHWEDVRKDYISIHRQQIRRGDMTPITFVEVDYTKDTRCKTGQERKFPITPAIREILDLADALPGDSVYVFHDEHGNMITKDSYEMFLRRYCKRLGLSKTNNHAFRKALNNNVLIPAGFSANERAALLGHSVRTNEQHYSLRRSDRLSEMGSILAQLREKERRIAANETPESENPKEPKPKAWKRQQEPLL